MCGIVAIYSPDPVDHSYLEPMTKTLHHRGPDDCGLLQAPPVSLGHRRLSILDLSASGRQPMFSEDRAVALVCNGEIYNYLGENKQLREKGHLFISQSDSETLVHLYEEYGEGMLDRVNGMFAFALWDARQRQLMAAVDRFGKKPLYYAWDGRRLLLASEMKALLLAPWLSRELDPQAIDRYLSLRYVPPPLTMFKQVRKLEPAQMLLLREGRLKIERYWHPRPEEPKVFDQAAQEQYQELLTDAVRIRLQSDVPLGVYLSGGLDSTAVAGLMRSLSQGPKVSYTLSLDYKYDERQSAGQIAEYLGFEFNPITVNPHDFDSLDSILYHLDEPLGDLLAIPAYLLAREAKKKLTVVLTGDGADETLIGYLHQKTLATWQRWRHVLRHPSLGRAAARLVDLVPPAALNLLFDYPDRLGRRELTKLSQTMARASAFGTFYEGLTSCFTPQDKARLCDPSWWRPEGLQPLSQQIETDLAQWGDFPFLSRLSLLDLKYWIPLIVIFRLDKLNMANAVETRSPFLDYRLVQMALNLSDQAKLDQGRNKVALRQVVANLYPEHLRPKGKQAFYMPVTPRNRARFEAWIATVLTPQNLQRRGLFNWGYVEELLGLSRQGSMLANRQLTCLAMLEQWCALFLDQSDQKALAGVHS